MERPGVAETFTMRTSESEHHIRIEVRLITGAVIEFALDTSEIVAG
jgi:hypothetical protein